MITYVAGEKGKRFDACVRFCFVGSQCCAAGVPSVVQVRGSR